MADFHRDEAAAVDAAGVAPVRGHAHTFGHELKRSGEMRTQIVVGLTVITMGLEIAVGVASHSMALLADGLHMASHVVALTIAAFAYAYARRHADDPRFSFGTGKVDALAGFTGAIVLVGFAAVMCVESAQRLAQPVGIAFNEAILVAVVGLAVNVVSAYVLAAKEHGADASAAAHVDHNRRAAYLHVAADALTSVLAIVALMAAKYLGWTWIDPAVGLLGAALIAKWSYGLLKDTSDVLLDRQAPPEVLKEMTECMQVDGCVVDDLHVWSIGTGVYSGIVSLLTDTPNSTDMYRARVPTHLGVQHLSVEVRTHGEPHDATSAGRG
jgi:cation diffusion facilitator family transporter